MLPRHTVMALITAVAMATAGGCSSSAPSPGESGSAASVGKAAAGGGLTPVAVGDKEGAKSTEAKAEAPTAKTDAKNDAKLTSSTGSADSTAAIEPEAAPVDLESLLPELVAGFRSPFSVQVFEAAEKFRQLPPQPRRDALNQLSAHDSPHVRQNAWRAFATWATRDDVPTLIAALQSQHDDVRTAALDLLGKFPNDETIGVLTKLLEDPEFRERAEALLVRVGPAAEGAVLAYINHTDAGLRSASWRVLGEIGSRKSLLALEQLATEPEFQKEAELKNVLGKIRERLRK